VQPNLCFRVRPAQPSMESCLTSTSATLLAAQTSSSNLTDYCKQASKITIIWLWFRNRDPRLQRPAGSASCILAIGSGQRILYRLGSGLWLVPVLRRSRFLNHSPIIFSYVSNGHCKRYRTTGSQGKVRVRASLSFKISVS